MMQEDIKRASGSTPNQRPVRRVTQDVIKAAPLVSTKAKVDLEDTPQKEFNKPKKRRIFNRWSILFVVILIIISGAVSYYLLVYKKQNSALPYPLSKQTQGLLGFDIYYPDQNLLPDGYQINMNSFSYSDQTVIYSVSYGNGQKILFSIQSKPTDAQIAQFYAKNMPLRTTYTTPNGTATVGAINGRSVISLPTKTNAWILATAPGNINQDSFKQTVSAIKLSR